MSFATIGRLVCVTLALLLLVVQACHPMQSVPLPSIPATTLINAYSCPVYSAFFGPEPQTLVTAGADGLVKAWNTDTGKLRWQIRAHGRTVRKLVPSGDRRFFATMGDFGDAKIGLWDAGNGGIRGRVLLAGDEYPETLGLSRDGALVASGTSESVLRVWKREDRKATEAFSSRFGGITALQFSPTHPILAVGCRNGTAVLWSQEEGFFSIWRGGSDPIAILSLSKDGSLLASGDDAGTVRVWEVQTGRNAQKLHFGHVPIRQLAFSPRGDLVVCGSFDGFVRIWSVSDGRSVAEVRGVGGSFNFSADQQWMAVGGQDTTIEVRELPSLAVRWRLSAPTTPYTVQFSPEGSQIATWSDDGKVRLWALPPR